MPMQQSKRAFKKPTLGEQFCKVFLVGDIPQGVLI